MNMRLRPSCPPALLLALCLLAALPARAVLPAQTVADALALAREAALALAPPGARIEVLPGALDPRLRLAPCQRVQAFLPANAQFWGAGRVGLRCQEGPVAWQVQLPVTVHIWAPAVVAAAPLPAGTRIEASQLQLAETDWASSAARPHTRIDQLADRVLARALNAGQAIRQADLKPLQLFAQGDTVQIQALGRGFAIAAEGQALGPGLEGQPVRVRTESGRVVVAVPVAPRRVEMTL
jgi:flagella basal body P-ring formation protein FlgA